MVFNLDADNWVEPEFLERAVDVLGREDDDKLAFIYPDSVTFGDYERHNRAPEFSLERFKTGNYVDMNSLVNTSIARQFGFDPAFNDGWGDYDFFLTLAKNGYTGRRMPDCPLRYRVHGASITASTREYELRAAVPNAVVLRQDSNQGFARGVNIGIRHALAEVAPDYIWVLNNDTRLPAETLERLLAKILTDNRLGIIATPLLEGDEGKERRVSGGSRLIKPWMIPVAVKRGKPFDYLAGTSLLLNRRMLEEIGLFDERFFFFFEDADLSLRARQAGWRLAVAEEAEIRHLGSSTIRRLNRLQARYYRSSHVRFTRKHSRHPFYSAVGPFVFRVLMDLVTLRWQAVVGNWQGWREGWKF